MEATGLRPRGTFSAEEAYEAHEEGEPIMLSAKRARRMVEVEHQAEPWSEFIAHAGEAEEYDAWIVLEWLGY